METIGFFRIQILIFRMLRNNADVRRCLYFELGLQQCVQSGLFLLLHANLRGEGRGFEGPLCNLNCGLPTCRHNLIDTMTSYSNTVSRAYFIYNQIWVSVGSKYHFSTLKKFCFVLSQLTPTPKYDCMKQISHATRRIRSTSDASFA